MQIPPRHPAPASPYVLVLEMYHGFIKNYNYLVVDPVTERSLIVDPAWEMDKIAAALTATSSTLAGVLITHGHPDHVDLAAAVATKHRVPIWMSRGEIRASGFSAPWLIPVDDEPWTVGHLTVRPLATPGHTPGSLCYLVGDAIFTGDTLFAEGCGICPDVPAAHAMFHSLKKLQSTLHPATRVFPGHSYGKPPGRLFSELLRENIYLQFKEPGAFAAFRLRKRQHFINLFGQ